MKKWFIASFALVALVAVAFVVVSSILLSPVFVFRILTQWDASTDDYRFFPSAVIAASENPHVYEYDLNPELADLPISYRTTGGQEVTTTLADFVESTGSTSFIIVQNDTVIYEQYANGSDRDSVHTSFSAAKSLVSLMIGRAIDDGYIESQHQSMADFIPEFSGTDMEHITIEDLLLMRSGIYYEETGFLWFRHDAYTYWMPNLRDLAIGHQRLTDRHEGRFHYNNYNPLLLGIILERSTGMSVSEYFEQSFWQPIGTKYDASWSLDSDRSQFEKMESGFNFRSIDLIRIGSMLLHDGYWNEQQIVSPEWIQASTVVDFPLNTDEYAGTFLEGLNIGYGYLWYSRPSDASGLDFWAWGRFDQILYVSPANDMVILRTGDTGGGVDNFSEVLADIIALID
ncbi:MAG: beta-lactamase family protein [Coriobacteriia bacterium]|nr:beta-lactamase family protein [Coriobacteriia bacterium]MCL2870494.1 beta-lactamase family protein [Coriobacteriia bacterium]